MTEVMFHFNVADRMGYACRLLRKAQVLGANVVVAAPEPTLSRFDRLLWAFEALDFVPHVRVSGGHSIAPRLQATPVWLVEQVNDAPHREALLNLSDDLVLGFESFAKLIEIVPCEEQGKRSARQRWKHYADRGYALKRHEAAQ